MPTYKNNTTERIVSQDIVFDPNQIKTSTKILVEEIISFEVLAGTFQIGETITGATLGAEGTVLRFDSEDNILDLIKRDDGLVFGPVKDADAVPPVVGETLTGGAVGATGELVSTNVELTRTLDTPDFKDVICTEVASSADAEVEKVLIDIDKTKAIVIICNAVVYSIALNRVANIIHAGLGASNDIIIETDVETRLVILTQVGGGAASATVLQFTSIEQAYRYFD